jgi:hypothetical protein
LGQREVFIGYYQVRVKRQLETQASTVTASAVGTIETERPRFNLWQASIALSASKLLGENQRLSTFHVRFDNAFTFTKGRFHRLSDAAEFRIWPHNQTVDDQFDVVPFLPVKFQASQILKH